MRRGAGRTSAPDCCPLKGREEADTVADEAEAVGSVDAGAVCGEALSTVPASAGLPFVAFPGCDAGGRTAGASTAETGATAMALASALGAVVEGAAAPLAGRAPKAESKACEAADLDPIGKEAADVAEAGAATTGRAGGAAAATGRAGGALATIGREFCPEAAA